MPKSLMFDFFSSRQEENYHHKDTKARKRNSKNLFFDLRVFVPLWLNLFFEDYRCVLMSDLYNTNFLPLATLDELDKDAS
jgi:hypothetical protein